MSAPDLTPVPVLEDTDHGLVVRITYPHAGVDRPSCFGMGINSNSRKLAERYAAAVRAGVALADAEVHTDVNGKTYVSARSVCLARMLNADLRRLGF